MSKTAQLVFSTDGKTAHIVFKNGKESDIFESKNQVLRSLPGMIDKQKLTADEATEIAKAVFQAENLPNRDSSEPLGLLGMLMSIMPGVTVVGIGISSGGGNMEKTFPEINADEDVTKPILRMCACGEHANILLSKTGKSETGTNVIMSPNLYSKYHGQVLVREAQKTHGLPDDEAERLLSEIQQLPLPEFSNVTEQALAEAESEIKN